MTKIKTIDKAVCRRLRTEMQKKLDVVGRSLGVSIAVGNASYDQTGSNAIFKLEVATVDGSGTVKTVESTDFMRYAAQYGFKPADLGREFVVDGRTYKIVGLRRRASKKPISIERDDGQTFVSSAENVLSRLKLEVDK